MLLAPGWDGRHVAAEGISFMAEARTENVAGAKGSEKLVIQVDPVDLPKVNALGRKETKRGTIARPSTFCIAKRMRCEVELSRNISLVYKKNYAMAARLPVHRWLIPHRPTVSRRGLLRLN